MREGDISEWFCNLRRMDNQTETETQMSMKTLETKHRCWYDCTQMHNTSRQETAKGSIGVEVKKHKTVDIIL